MNRVSIRISFMTIAGALLLLVVVANLWITNTLVDDGRLSAQEALMHHAAERSGHALAQDSDSPLIDTDNLKVYPGWDTLPDSVRLITQGQEPDQDYTMILNEQEDPRIGALMRYPLPSGQVLFVHLHFNPDLLPPQSGVLLMTQLMLNLATFLLILVLGWFLNHQVLRPIRNISQQLRQMDWESQDLGSPPQVRYQELQTVYDALFASAAEVRQQQERETQFLRFASHELRTPIAVVRSSLELEQKRHGQLSAPMQRAQEANEEMQALVETLLWLGHRQRLPPEQEDVALDELLQLTLEQHRHRLSPKVSLKCQTQPYRLRTVRQPLQILVNNLLRSSLEHGQGQVELVQKGGEITLTNGISAENKQGFGLGMMLVRQLSQQFGWRVQTSTEHGFHRVTITLTTPDNGQ